MRDDNGQRLPIIADRLANAGSLGLAWPSILDFYVERCGRLANSLARIEEAGIRGAPDAWPIRVRVWTLEIKERGFRPRMRSSDPGNPLNPLIPRETEQLWDRA